MDLQAQVAPVLAAIPADHLVAVAAVRAQAVHAPFQVQAHLLAEAAEVAPVEVAPAVLLVDARRSARVVVVATAKNSSQ